MSHALENKNKNMENRYVIWSAPTHFTVKVNIDPNYQAFSGLCVIFEQFYKNEIAASLSNRQERNSPKKSWLRTFRILGKGF